MCGESKPVKMRGVEVLKVNEFSYLGQQSKAAVHKRRMQAGWSGGGG